MRTEPLSETDINRWPTSRRSIARAVAGIAAGAMVSRPLLARAIQTPDVPIVSTMTIDLAAEPESIDPALAYSARDWSIVHSIFDAPLGFSVDGTIVPLAAETFAATDTLTWNIVLRQGLTFHDGSPVTSAAIRRSLDYIRSSTSLAVDLFAGITSIDTPDERTAVITTAEPQPWLPAQIAVWMVLLPDGFNEQSAQSAPVGSGPYRFVSYERGVEIRLERFEEYPGESAKGQAITDEVTYRFVPEPATRVADLSTGAAQLITEVPPDQFAGIGGPDAQVVESDVVGSAWIRLPSDVEPFSDPRVRAAMNHAIDVEGIAAALVSSKARRLASLFPDDRALGFDPALSPYPYDPDRARALLADAGLGKGFATQLEIREGGRIDVAEAIAGQLGEVGCTCEVVVTDSTSFNATWKDPQAAPLKMATWSPLYDPQTLLGLVFAREGFLSRYMNEDASSLITKAASEPDPAVREELYQQLGAVMFDDPPAIFLWNLTTANGVHSSVATWTPRGDEYVLAMTGPS